MSILHANNCKSSPENYEQDAARARRRIAKSEKWKHCAADLARRMVESYEREREEGRRRALEDDTYEPSERDRRISDLLAEDKANGVGQAADRVFFLLEYPGCDFSSRPLTPNELQIAELLGELQETDEGEMWVAVWHLGEGHFVRKQFFTTNPPVDLDSAEDIAREVHCAPPRESEPSESSLLQARSEFAERIKRMGGMYGPSGWIDISKLNMKAFETTEDEEQTTENKPTENKPTEQPTTETRLAIPAFSSDWCDVTKIPRRRWLYGQHYVRGSATITIAESGIGKSTLEICEAIAMASGESLLGVTVDEPVKVLYWNGEEPRDEIARRVHAVCEHYKIKPHSIADKFHFTSGLDQFPIKIVQATRKGIGVDTKLVADIVDYIRANDIGVMFIDPLISCHSVPENDTSGMDAVAKTWAKVATATNCAIELVHHTRKPGREGDGENHIADARGAGALVAAVRGSRIINQMTEKEAGEFDIEGERFEYFRLNRGKVNMTRRGSTSWFRLVSVTIGNSEPNMPNEGDNMQTLIHWKPPDVLDIVTIKHMHAVRAKAASGEYLRDPKAKDGTWFGEVIAEVVGLDVNEQRMAIERILKHLIGFAC
jgi:hypothetical protein